MKVSFFIAAAFVFTASGAVAQQRSAGQAYDAQVNWASLGSKLDAVSTQNKALAAALTTLQGSVDGINAKLDTIAACGAQGKVWNGKGCAATASPPAPHIEIGSFSERNPGAGPLCGNNGRCNSWNPASDAYCRARGYDALSSYSITYGHGRLGGHEGGSETTYPDTYSIRCFRVR